jgi:hypothetical protein
MSEPKKMKLVRLEMEPPPSPLNLYRRGVPGASGGLFSEEMLRWMADIGDDIRDAGRPRLVGPLRMDVAIHQSVPLSSRKAQPFRVSHIYRQIVRVLETCRVIRDAKQIQEVTLEELGDVNQCDPVTRPILVVVSEITRDSLEPDTHPF